MSDDIDGVLAEIEASFRRALLRRKLHAAFLGMGAAFAVLGQLSSTYAVLARSLPGALHPGP